MLNHGASFQSLDSLCVCFVFLYIRMKSIKWTGAEDGGGACLGDLDWFVLLPTFPGAPLRSCKPADGLADRVERSESAGSRARSGWSEG